MRYPRPESCDACCSYDVCKKPCDIRYAKDPKFIRNSKNCIRILLDTKGMARRVPLFPRGTKVVPFTTFQRLFKLVAREKCYGVLASQNEAELIKLTYGLDESQTQIARPDPFDDEAITSALATFERGFDETVES